MLAAYQRVVRCYASGEFEEALTAARELELSGGIDTPVHHTGRLLAAEMYTLRGEPKRAAGWLASVPVTTGCQALRAWVECGLRYRLDNDADAGLAVGWQVFTQLRWPGAPPGIDRLLPRLAMLAIRAHQPQRAEEVLAAAERIGERDSSALVTEMVMLTRALVRADLAAAQASVAMARQRGHRPAMIRACLVVADLTNEPRPWLREAYELARPLGSGHVRSMIGSIMRERGISTPRVRPARAAYSSVELRIIELIRDGWTNRQIAAEIRMSEKTIENYLTRLFARTGCRSRVELAAASVAGQLAAVGL